MLQRGQKQHDTLPAAEETEEELGNELEPEAGYSHQVTIE